MSLRSTGLSVLAASGKRHASTTTPIMSNKKLSSPARDKKAKNLCIVGGANYHCQLQLPNFFFEDIRSAKFATMTLKNNHELDRLSKYLDASIAERWA